VIYRAAKIARALLARVEPGEDLHAALRELARWEKLDHALVRGSGLLEAATLEPAAGGAPERLAGPLALSSLAGVLTLRGGVLELRLDAVLAPPGGTEVRAGRLAAARAAEVELVVDVLEDVSAQWDTPLPRSP
jgi:predicted DNA-binding protein with PD1-like motif